MLPMRGDQQLNGSLSCGSCGTYIWGQNLGGLGSGC